LLGALGAVGGAFQVLGIQQDTSFISTYLAFGFYAGLNMVAFFMIFFLMPGNFRNIGMGAKP